MQFLSTCTTLGNYVFESWDSDTCTFKPPRSLHSKGSKHLICLVILSDKHLKLKQDHVIVTATEVQEIIEKQPLEDISVQKITLSKDVHEIP